MKKRSWSARRVGSQYSVGGKRVSRALGGNCVLEGLLRMEGGGVQKCQSKKGGGGVMWGIVPLVTRKSPMVRYGTKQNWSEGR